MTRDEHIVPPDGLGPKRPPAWANWKDCGPWRGSDDEIAHVWRRGRLTVISSLAWADFRGVGRWQWLISVSIRGSYGSDADVERALRDFGMTAADEDNHEPGAVRKWWLPCDLKVGEESACECKATEVSVVETSGLTWQIEHGKDVAAAREEMDAMRAAARITGWMPR